MSERTRTALMWILGVAVLGAGIWMLVKDDDGLRVTDVWARSSPMVDGAAAAYMNIQGGAEDDALVSASVAADVAGKVELHETRMVDGKHSMQMVPAIDIPAGGSVALEPGGYHIMLMGLVEPLEPGDTFEMELVFESGATITVEVEVREG